MPFGIKSGSSGTRLNSLLTPSIPESTSIVCYESLELSPIKSLAVAQFPLTLGRIHSHPAGIDPQHLSDPDADKAFTSADHALIGLARQSNDEIKQHVCTGDQVLSVSMLSGVVAYAVLAGYKYHC